MADFLAPLSPLPAYGDELADQIQASVAGIAGLPGSLVRPRWQPDPPPQPPKTTDWCAVGVTDTEASAFTSDVHDGRGNGGDGATTAYRDVEFTVLASFYGPNSQGYAAALRDGFAAQQNRTALMSFGLAFIRSETIRNASGLYNVENLNRFDIEFRLRRRDARTYAVPSIRSVSGALAVIRAIPRPLPHDTCAPDPADVTPFRIG